MTRTHALHALLAAILILFQGPFVSAARADGDPSPTLASYDPKTAHGESDTNGDGLVDRREFYDRMVEIFYLADTNKDGQLVVAELVVIREPMVMKDGDRNKDDKLTLKEFVNIRYRAFDAADRNHDGELSIDEVVEAYGN